MAADYRNNPFTLTYDGAIAENVQGKVNIHPVKYTQKQTGIEVVANVYTPANYNAKKKYPTIVVAHPNGGVKEQVAGLYAQRLAEQGYLTIAFDAAYQGGSGGLYQPISGRGRQPLGCTRHLWRGWLHHQSGANRQTL